MATLYMLHLEQQRPHLQPLDDHRGVGVSSARRPLLKRFGNWVRCQCRDSCQVQWNFVNDLGLHRGGAPGKCTLTRFLDEGTVPLLSSRKKMETLKEQTIEVWVE